MNITERIHNAVQDMTFDNITPEIICLIEEDMHELKNSVFMTSPQDMEINRLNIHGMDLDICEVKTGYNGKSYITLYKKFIKKPFVKGTPEYKKCIENMRKDTSLLQFSVAKNDIDRFIKEI